jgi:hypothetical protein
MDKEIVKLIKEEGWEVKNGKVVVYGKEFPLVHPFAIHSKLYRTEENPDIKYQHLKRMHDLMWPGYVASWNYWDERRFRAHCEGYNYISYAGGASTGKSNCAARLALLFWLANPAKRTVLVASTTLESLNSRIFGYCSRFLDQAAIKHTYTYYEGKPPKILYNTKDRIHGVYAVAAKQGDDDKAIKDLIGRHPEEGLMIILDESTDMPLSLLKSLPNLEAGGIFFQIMVIGNSLSKLDLHGALSTPKEGWKSVDPLKHIEWETTQKNGICLFFSCYDSPAIHEQDPEKKKVLSRFLITKERLEENIIKYGKDSEAFWRFVLGFWRNDGSDDTVLSYAFIKEFNTQRTTEWFGRAPLKVVAGLDVAFSTGGDQVVLRLGVLGQEMGGQIVLDYGKDSLLFKLKLLANTDRSAELQIAEQVLSVLQSYHCPVSSLAIDVTGQGRAIGEVIRLRAGAVENPIKIYSTKVGQAATREFDVVVKNSLELWTDMRDFIQTDQIRGLDDVTIVQLTSRRIEVQEKSGKRVLESKAKFKAAMGSINPSMARSPDEADAAALVLQAAKIKYGFRPGQRIDVIKQESFDMAKWEAELMHKREEAAVLKALSPVATFSHDINCVPMADSFYTEDPSKDFWPR